MGGGVLGPAGAGAPVGFAGAGAVGEALAGAWIGRAVGDAELLAQGEELCAFLGVFGGARRRVPGALFLPKLAWGGEPSEGRWRGRCREGGGSLGSL